LFISLRAIIKNKPFIINLRWIFLIIAITFIPAIIFNIIALVEIGLWEQSGLFSLLPALFFVLVMIFSYFAMKGYSVYGVNNVDFRNSVINSLNSNSIKFEEKMNKVKLIDMNNELKIVFIARFETGMIKIKNKKDNLIFRKIIDGIKIYFRENNIVSKKFIAVFHLIFGVLFLVFGIGLIILMWKL
jgi:hypothetical protein